MAREDSPSAELARRDLELEGSKYYMGFVVRFRLKRVPNEAVKCGAFARKEEVRRFLHQHIEFAKSPDWHVLQSNHEMHGAFPWSLCPLSWPLGSGVSQLFSWLPWEEEAASCEGLVTECPWCVEAGRPQQVARTGWFTLRSVLDDVAHVCP